MDETRKLAAHPDATLLHDLREALGQLPAGVVERVRADFAKRAERKVVDADRAAGTQWRGSSSSDSGETMEEADDGGAAAGAPRKGGKGAGAMPSVPPFPVIKPAAGGGDGFPRQSDSGSEATVAGLKLTVMGPGVLDGEELIPVIEREWSLDTGRAMPSREPEGVMETDTAAHGLASVPKGPVVKRRKGGGADVGMVSGACLAKREEKSEVPDEGRRQLPGTAARHSNVKKPAAGASRRRRSGREDGSGGGGGGGARGSSDARAECLGGLTQEQIVELKQAFLVCGRAGKSAKRLSITSAELDAVMQSLAQYPTVVALQNLVSEAGVDGTGTVGFPKLLPILAQVWGDVGIRDKLIEASNFDSDAITVAELGEVAAALCDEARSQGCSVPMAIATMIGGMIHVANADGGGVMGLPEVLSFMAQYLEDTGIEGLLIKAFEAVDCTISARKLGTVMRSLDQYPIVVVMQDMINEPKEVGDSWRVDFLRLLTLWRWKIMELRELD